MKRRVLLQLGIPLLILCALFLLLAYPADRTLRPQSLLEVSVILRETDASLWTNARQGMEQAAMDLDVELRFLTPAQNNDAAQQAELLKREASGGAQAAVLVAADREVLAQTVAGLSGKLPVVSLETDMTHDGAVCFVGTDNQALGRSLGEAVLHGVEKGGTVVLLDSAPGDNAVTQRLAEAQSVLEAAGRSVAICRPEGDETIAQALESILAQTMGELEVLLIDDGSPDGSGALCDQIAGEDSRVRVFHKENGGVSSARSLGMAQARGTYLSFVDADDWLPADALETLYRALREAGADTAGGAHNRVETDGRQEKEPGALPAGVYGSEEIRRGIVDRLLGERMGKP